MKTVITDDEGRTIYYENGAKYVRLRVGDTIEAGDEFRGPCLDRWIKTSAEGCQVTFNQEYYRRRIWVDERDWTDADPIPRKSQPVYSGVMRYFPRAMRAVAHGSKMGNDQHNPGTELHWDRSKSGDELDALSRHLLQCGTKDTDGVWHDTKVAWRALANLEKLMEEHDEFGN